MKVTDQQLALLLEAVGLSPGARGKCYRNRLLTGEGSDNWPICLELCELGLMEDQGEQAQFAGMHLFWVTIKGEGIVRKEQRRLERSRNCRRVRRRR